MGGAVSGVVIILLLAITAGCLYIRSRRPTKDEVIPYGDIAVILPPKYAPDPEYSYSRPLSSATPASVSRPSQMYEGETSQDDITYTGLNNSAYQILDKCTAEEVSTSKGGDLFATNV